MRPRYRTACLLLAATTLGTGFAGSGVNGPAAASVSGRQRTVTLVGSILSVNVPEHRLVLLSAERRYLVFTTSTTTVRLENVRVALTRLRAGQRATVRAHYAPRYLVALSIAARMATSAPPTTSTRAQGTATGLLLAAHDKEDMAPASSGTVVTALGPIARSASIASSE